jgi:hypothetical protein
VWESEGIAPPFLTSALHGGEWSASRPGRFTPEQRAPGTHWIGGWVAPRTGLDDVEKRNISPLPELGLRPLGQPGRSQSLSRVLSKNGALTNLNYFQNKGEQIAAFLHVPEWNINVCDKLCRLFCLLAQSACLQEELPGPLLTRRPWTKCKTPRYWRPWWPQCKNGRNDTFLIGKFQHSCRIKVKRGKVVLVHN